ncbi:MAG: energy transducer TonB [Thiogranum sp.]
MRLLAAFIPAGLITLVLFALMQHLITGGRQPVAPPAQTGFVDLIRLQAERVEADTPSRRAAPGRRQLSEDTPPLPETLTTEVAPPRLSRLAMVVPEPPPPELAGGPYLGTFEPPQLADNRVVLPVQQPVKTGQAAASSPSASPPGPASDKPAAAGTVDLASGLNGIGNGDGAPIPLLRIEPAYPRKAARNRKEGWVKVAFTITERGTVIDPQVLESRPRRLFNRSAVAAIRKWKFRPKVIDGTPVPTRATQVIEFNLAGR